MAGLVNVNVTVDDTDPSIVYVPSSAWKRIDGGVTLGRRTRANVKPKNGGGDGKSGSSNSGSSSISGGSGRHRRRRRRILRKRGDDDGEDSDDDEEDVAIQFAFNGTSIRLYTSLSSLDPASNVSLSFTLDGHTYPSYSSITNSTSSTQKSVPVLSVPTLRSTTHILEVALAPNSVFAFDYLVYTHMSNPGQSSQAQSDVVTKKKGVATFSAAIASSVGVLALFSFGIFLSICIRRRRSKRRERRLASATLDSNDDEEGGDGRPSWGDRDHTTRQMIGPKPFVPRYFPGTVPPPAVPPPYPGPSTLQSSEVAPLLPPPAAIVKETSTTTEREPAPSYSASVAVPVSHADVDIRAPETLTLEDNSEDPGPDTEDGLVPPSPPGLHTATNGRPAVELEAPSNPNSNTGNASVT